MSREQIVRDTAYAIWEAEGKPEGRDAEHWLQAEKRVAASTQKTVPAAKAPAKGKVSDKAATAAPEAKAPAKAAATKPAPAKKAGTKKA